METQMIKVPGHPTTHDLEEGRITPYCFRGIRRADTGTNDVRREVHQT